jgi:hypothetical protein
LITESAFGIIASITSHSKIPHLKQAGLKNTTTPHLVERGQSARTEWDSAAKWVGMGDRGNKLGGYFVCFAKNARPYAVHRDWWESKLIWGIIVESSFRHLRDFTTPVDVKGKAVHQATISTWKLEVNHDSEMLFNRTVAPTMLKISLLFLSANIASLSGKSYKLSQSEQSPWHEP